MVVTGRVRCRGCGSLSTAASQSCDYYAVFIDASLQAAQRSKVFSPEVVQTFQKSVCVLKRGLQHGVTELRQIIVILRSKNKTAIFSPAVS